MANSSGNKSLFENMAQSRKTYSTMMEHSEFYNTFYNINTTCKYGKLNTREISFTRHFKLPSSPNIMQSSGSHQAVIRQSSGSHQAVIRQSSGSHQAVIRQSSGSHQAVIRQSSGSHQTVTKQPQYIHCAVTIHSLCSHYTVTLQSSYSHYISYNHQAVIIQSPYSEILYKDHKFYFIVIRNTHPLMCVCVCGYIYI